MALRNPFWNGRQHRLRALWRLLVWTGLFFAGSRAAGRLMTAASAWLPAGAWHGLQALALLATLAVVLGSVWLAGRLLDRRRFADFGFHVDPRWWGDLAFGLGLGALLMLGIFLAEWAAGWIRIRGALQVGRSSLPGLATALVTFICVGIYEEAMSRGYPLRNLAEGLNLGRLGPRGGILLAWAGTSAAFGLLHANNPNASTTSTASLILAGFFLGLGFVLTGELAIPIGIHIAWNLFQGNVFGFPVSGIDAGPSLIAIAQGGPEVWTGGAFGPEAGLIGLAALLAGSLAILAWVRWRCGRAGLCTELAEPPGQERGQAGADRGVAGRL